MSGSDSSPKVGVDVGLSARASIEAKISTEIPPQSTGRLVDAFTDIIRPFTERRGLKGDLIRLQREEVAIEIAQRARHRLNIENVLPSPVPARFLVPFFEKASLENIDSFLIDRWADLLVSASAQPGNAHPRFVQILSELDTVAAQLLRDIALYKAHNVKDLNSQFNPSEFAGLLLERIRGITEEIQLVNVDPARKCRELACKIMCLISGPGSSVADILVIHKADNNDHFASFDISVNNRQPANTRNDQNIFYVDLLCSLHLLNRYHAMPLRPEFERIEISYVQLTRLGIEFLRKCDRNIEQRFLNPLEIVNRVCDEGEFCPKLYDPEWNTVRRRRQSKP
jgi:hypothetical protein